MPRSSATALPGNAAEAAMNDVSRHEVERTAAEAVAATVPASRAGVEALVGYLRDLERSLPRNDNLHDAMPDGFEAAVRENIRVALKAMAWLEMGATALGSDRSQPRGV
jgi:hypothetical protein